MEAGAVLGALAMNVFCGILRSNGSDASRDPVLLGGSIVGIRLRRLASQL